MTMKKLNEFATLADAQAYTYVNERMISPDMVVSILTDNDCVISLQNHAQTDDKAAGFLLALSGSVTEFNVMNSHPVGQAQQSILQHLVDIGAINATAQAHLIGYANVTVQPYQNTSQQDFDDAQKDNGTSSQVVNYLQGQDIILTLNDTLPNPVSVTTWLCNEGFKEENLGRGTHVDEPLKYRIPLKDKRISGKVEVRVDREGVNFTVEAV